MNVKAKIAFFCSSVLISTNSWGRFQSLWLLKAPHCSPDKCVCLCLFLGTYQTVSLSELFPYKRKAACWWRRGKQSKRVKLQAVKQWNVSLGSLLHASLTPGYIESFNRAVNTKSIDLAAHPLWCLFWLLHYWMTAKDFSKVVECSKVHLYISTTLMYLYFPWVFTFFVTLILLTTI